MIDYNRHDRQHWLRVIQRDNRIIDALVVIGVASMGAMLVFLAFLELTK